MKWTEAFKQALEATWPSVATKSPPGVEELRRVLDSLPFTAPEALSRPARRAWSVLQHEPVQPDGDTTPVGRAAVALTYVIQELKDELLKRA